MPGSMRVILNPMSRHGAGGRLRAVIDARLRAHGVDFDLVETTGPGHASELAQAAAELGITTVVAAGGDGTVHDVVNGLMAAAQPARLGLIPIGTGNDFVKMVPGAATFDEALTTLAGSSTTEVDVGIAEWDGGSEYFINAMGTGIDVEVVRQMRRSRVLPGAVIYVSALLRALVRYRPLAVRLAVDGTAVEQRIMNLAVCNGPSIGGSFRICPDARPDDGVLDVCLIAEMTLLRNARMVPRVITGTHTGRTGVTMLRGAVTELSLTDDGAMWFQLDGELRQSAGAVRARLAPTRLRVVCSAHDTN